MRLFALIFFAFFLNSCRSYQVIRELRKQINDGEILGRYMTSETGRTISAFIGIPFASPPVDDLRFRAPQKVTPWNGTLLTQNQRAKCPQIDSFGGSTVYEGDEDCLFVNVYVPETTSDTRLDVLVWIHGGGFTLGHGGPTSYGPEYLLEHDIILVAGNYRLGPLGFLSTEDRNSPGNFGLKDQAFLLQWVHDNIEHFGGNQNSVTIWGESAGAASVHYQMISPLSEGLFHRGIANSGGLSAPARSGVARAQAVLLAQRIGCPILDDTTAIVQCLRSASPEDLINEGLRFPLVVESFESDESAFIDQRNYNNRFTSYSAIPLLVGMNSEESLLSLSATMENDTLLSALLSNWDVTVPATFGYSHLDEAVRATITRRANVIYFGNEATPTMPLDSEQRQQLMNLFTDTFLTFTETVQRRVEDSNHSSTYLYLFTHKGKASFSATTHYLGTSHADDLIPLFPLRKTVFYSSIPSSQDREVTDVMSLMWTNFVRFGNPTPNSSPNWLPVTSSSFASMQYMQIGNENGRLANEVLQAKTDFFSARAEFWKGIREDYNLNAWFDDSLTSFIRHFL